MSAGSIHPDADAFDWCPACSTARCRWDRARGVWTCSSCARAWRGERDGSGRLLPRAALIPSLLDPRAPTPNERAAHDEDPRPGVWAGESGADLRALTQDETDMLIRAELWMTLPLGVPEAERLELFAVVGEVKAIQLTRTQLPTDGPGREPLVMLARTQRGGIDSDPLVRLLAYRAWGDRDRRWFELRGVRNGDELVAFNASRPGRPVLTQRAWPSDPSWRAGVALGDARPGELVDVEQSGGTPERRISRFVVGKRLREEPAPLLSLRLARRELAQANIPEIDRRLGIVPGMHGDMVGALAYHLQVEYEILRSLDAGEPAEDVARRVMLGSQLSGDQVWFLVEVAMRRRPAAPALELDDDLMAQRRPKPSA